MKDLVEVLEIWMPTKDIGEVYSMERGAMKCIAIIVNGFPLKLEKDFYLEKKYISKEEKDSLLEQYK